MNVITACVYINSVPDFFYDRRCISVFLVRLVVEVGEEDNQCTDVSDGEAIEPKWRLATVVQTNSQMNIYTKELSLWNNKIIRNKKSLAYKCKK